MAMKRRRRSPLALKAQRLIFVTDVEGVMDSAATVIERVPREVSLADAPFVSGGMKPKIRAVEAAVGWWRRPSVVVGRTIFGDLP
jgi:acetylglutamate kinase